MGDGPSSAFGALLRTYRLAAGLSQEALAERAGLSARGISDLERGLRRMPQRETVALLAAALGLDPAAHARLDRAVRRTRIRQDEPALPASPFLALCCARADRQAAGRVAQDLRACGLACWLEDAGRAPESTAWEQRQRAAIRACVAVLLLVTPASRGARFVPEALRIAQIYGRATLALWLEGEAWPDCAPQGWEALPRLDGRGPGYAAALDALLPTVLQASQARGDARALSLPGPDAHPRNPYKGLRAFGSADAGDYFGQERLVGALLAQVAALAPCGPRLLAVVGPSGSGKSSAVLAGLLPRLQHGALPGSEGWRYLAPLLPGAHPLEALTVALGGALPGSGLAALRTDLEASTRGLHLLASRLALPAHDRVVLVVDQAEELFTLSTDEAERRHFVDLLVAAATEPRGALLAVLTLRADFYDRPLRYPALGALVARQQQVVLPLAVADLQAAIERPAALADVGVSFDPDLVGDLVFEVRGRPGALPLLEFTLDQLFERREGRRLTVAAYRAIGGVRGALTKHAEATFAALPGPEHRRLARALFLRLIDPGSTEHDTTRRRAALGELTLPDAEGTGVMREVAEAFVAARLLTGGEHAGLSTLEVSHEALIPGWPRLAGWLREAREDVRKARTISADAAEWAVRGRPVDHLYRGSVLAEALAWAERNVPSAEEMAFLEAGVAEGQRQEAAQRAMQERELGLARQAAAANRRAAARSRALAGLLAVFLLVAMGLSVYAFNNASLAGEAGTRAAANASAAVAALSRQLALQVGALAGSQPEIALLLGVEANRLSHTAAARVPLFLVVAGDARVRHFLDPQTGAVYAVAYSPDGTLLASGGADETIQLWDATTGRPQGVPLGGHTGYVTSLAFSPDGGLLASGSRDGTIRLWDMARRQPLGPPFIGHTGTVNGVAFSPDGKVLASGGLDGAVRLWEVARQRPLGRPFGGQTGSINSVAFSPDGKTLAAGGVDGTIRLWDVARGDVRGSPLSGHTAAVIRVAFSPDGGLLASGSQDGTIRLWDMARRQPLGQPFMGHTGAVNGLAFSPDGKVLTSGGADETIQLWDVASEQPLGPALTGHTGAVNSLAFSPDGKTLASGSTDTTIRLWDVRERHAFVSAFTAGPGDGSGFGASGVSGVAFSPVGKVLASGSQDGTIRLWDPAHGQQLGPPLNGSIVDVGSVAFSPDGTILASGGADGGIELWDVAREQPLGPPLTGHTDSVGSLAFSPDGKLLASGSQDGTIRLWDAARQRVIGPPLTGHAGSVNGVAFSPDGKLLASGGADGTIRLWDVARHRQLGPPLNRITSPIDSVAFSPDGKTLASGSGTHLGSPTARSEVSFTDDAIQLWDVARRQPFVVPFVGHTNAVSSIAFSPDGTILASGSDDTTIRLWDVVGGQSLGSLPSGYSVVIAGFEGTRHAVKSVAFSPDGMFLASGSNDSTIQLWDLDPAPLVRRACAIATRNLTRQEWRQYLGNLPYHKTCANLP